MNEVLIQHFIQLISANAGLQLFIFIYLFDYIFGILGTEEPFNCTRTNKQTQPQANKSLYFIISLNS